MSLEHGNAHNPCCTETFHFPIITVQDSLFSTEKFNTPSTQMSSISLCCTRKGLTSYSCAIIFHIQVSSTFLLRHWNVQHFHHVTEMFNIPMTSLRCPKFLWPHWDIQYSYHIKRCSTFLSRHWDVQDSCQDTEMSSILVTLLRCSNLLSHHWDVQHCFHVIEIFTSADEIVTALN